MAWMHVQISSDEIRMPTSIEVLLPQTAVEKLSQEEKLPVLYLLHDKTGDHSEWLKKAALETYQEEVPIAIVMPSGNASCFVNLKYGKSYQNYIRDELPAICERLFPVSDKREYKYLAGAGMGGYGALNIALTSDCPFGMIGAFDADIDMRKHYAANPEKMEKIFGNVSEYEESLNCLYHAAENLMMEDSRNLPRIMMMGNQKGSVIEENERLYSIIKKKHDDIELQRDAGVSGWSYYGACLYRFMQSIWEEAWQL